jgi:outer membrane protein assembly factor BamB
MDDNVYCLDASTGAKLWNYTTGDNVTPSPAVFAGKVYVGSLDGSVYCLNASTGAKLWSYMTGYSVQSSPAVADGKVYIGSLDGSVYCLDASTGEELWSYATGNSVQSSPAVAYGKVYIGSNDGSVYCFGFLESDVTIINVTSAKTVIGQGYGGNVAVTAQNLGDLTQNFNVTIYANLTFTGALNFDLTSGSNASKLFVWNTTGFAYGNCTLKAAADIIPGETDIANNNYTCPVPVHVGVPGDISGSTQGVYDGTCNMRDIQFLILLFNTMPSSPNWKPNADVNNNGAVNMRDIQIAILNFGKHE